jgi:hypothetical protein
MDGLIHGGFLMRDHNGLAAIATRLDHAAFVVMAGLVADGVAEMHIDPPDAVAEPIQCGMHDALDVIGKLRAAMDIESVLTSINIGCSAPVACARVSTLDILPWRDRTGGNRAPSAR